MPVGPDEVLATYEREAGRWAGERNRSLWEAPALEECVAGCAPGLDVLDLSCGSGQPIAEWFLRRGDGVTCIDGARSMVAECRRRLPDAEVIHADMRDIALARQFDVIVAFNSFFHLAPDDQRAIFKVFAAHARPGARLLFTSGPQAGEAIGQVGESVIFHASLAPSEYRALLAAHGFEIAWFRPEDRDLSGYSVWLARRL